MIRHLFLILFVIAGGIGASQLPSFARAYEQRLGGALGEVQKLVDSFGIQAQAEGMDFAALVARHRASPDAAIRATADRMTALESRRRSLAAEAAALAGATTSVDKLIVVATQGDSELLRDTFQTFEITATLDPAFGAAGVGIGWLIYGAFAGLIGRRSRRATAGGFIRR